MFDHGILIDYQSTDRSREIVKDLAPHWTLLDSKFTRYDAKDNDGEFMMAEESVGGWKMCLCTTEFLLCPQLKEFVAYMDSSDALVGAICMGVTLADTPTTVDQSLDPLVPLLRQKHHGFRSSEMDGWASEFGHRDRIIHRAPNGKYHLGRHGCDLPRDRMAFSINVAYNVWAGWSPYRLLRERKLSIKHKMSDTDLNTPDRSGHHKAGPAELDGMFAARSAKSVDLYDTVPGYKEMVDLLPDQYR
jgi:hypothetical protein